MVPARSPSRSSAHRPDPHTSARHGERRTPIAACRSRRSPRSAPTPFRAPVVGPRSEEHTSELQSRSDLVCRLLLEKKKKQKTNRLSPASHPTEQTPPQQRSDAPRSEPTPTIIPSCLNAGQQDTPPRIRLPSTLCN